MFKKKLKNSFNSSLKTYIEYGNLAQDGAVKSKIELISRSMKHSIRIMIDMDKSDSVKRFYEYLKIIQFKENMKLLQ